jgi:hypothetical protein
MFANIKAKFHSLPNKTKIGIIYFGVAFLYNNFQAFNDGNNFLQVYKKFKTEKDPYSRYSYYSAEYQVINSPNKMKAVENGLKYTMDTRFFRSLVWPFDIVNELLLETIYQLDEYQEKEAKETKEANKKE